MHLQYAPPGRSIHYSMNLDITVAMSDTLTTFITVQPPCMGRTDVVPQVVGTIGHGLHYCRNSLDMCVVEHYPLDM